ncbi:MAG TPA: ATP-binding protein [Bacilli bacterium]
MSRNVNFPDDITGRNQTSVNLEDMKNRFQTLKDTALDAVIVMNSKGVIVEWNGRAEDHFGWREEEAIGRDLSELIIPQSFREKHKEGFRRFLETGESRILNKRIELNAIHREGNEFPVELTVSAIKLADTYLFSAFVRDITQRKYTEWELIQAKELAEAAAKAKSRFLATMSHEIRTPLNGIIGMTHLLADTPLNPEQKEYVDFLLKSENTLLSLISDILDFSKIESEEIDLMEKKFILQSCIAEMIDMLSIFAREKKLKLVYSIRPDVPSILVGDAPRLKQILTNLVGNAIKFTQTGGVSITVEQIHQQFDEVKLKFIIKDTGIGIPQEKIHQLFQPFSQLDSSLTGKNSGTGLGLAISKNLVQLMGGEIWIEPTESTGATFMFTIVFKLPQAVISQSNHDEEPAAEVSTKPVHILIAEDNRINQTVLLKMLQKKGIEADVVETGTAVLEAVKRTRYQLILMDIHMPEMDGIEAARQVREWCSTEECPAIIAVTANAFKTDKERYLSSGMDDYISKPIRWDHLFQVINKFVTNK